jgi:hypothetical protein
VEVLTRANDFNAQHIGTILWAYASLKIESPQLFEAFADAAQKKSNGAKAHDLAPNRVEEKATRYVSSCHVGRRMLGCIPYGLMGCHMGAWMRDHPYPGP